MAYAAPPECKVVAQTALPAVWYVTTNAPGPFSVTPFPKFTTPARSGERTRDVAVPGRVYRDVPGPVLMKAPSSGSSGPHELAVPVVLRDEDVLSAYARQDRLWFGSPMPKVASMRNVPVM